MNLTPSNVLSKDTQHKMNTRLLLCKLKDILRTFLTESTISLNTSFIVNEYLKNYETRVDGFSFKLKFRQDGDSPSINIDGRYFNVSFGFILQNKSVITKEFLH